MAQAFGFSYHIACASPRVSLFHCQASFLLAYNFSHLDTEREKKRERERDYFGSLLRSATVDFKDIDICQTIHINTIEREIDARRTPPPCHLTATTELEPRRGRSTLALISAPLADS
ncbi:hypothetical protein Hdeb2414_s0034g00726821 [Helianthus debilis subsp. tardiflorus]